MTLDISRKQPVSKMREYYFEFGLLGGAAVNVRRERVFCILKNVLTLKNIAGMFDG